MTGYERLQRIQQKLNEQGITDIKVFWTWASRDRPLSENAEALANVLDAYLDGRVHEAPDLKDSVRARSSNEVRE